MTIKPEVLAAIDLRFTSSNSIPVERTSIRDHEWQTIRDELLAMDTEISRLRGAISQHRDQFPDEALDGDIALWSVLDAMHNSAREVGE